MSDTSASAVTAAPAPPGKSGVALARVQRRAAEAVLGVLAGANADSALARVDSTGFDGATRAALTDLTYGTLRFLGETRGIARLFVHQKPEPLIEALLWIAIYQLRHSKTASHVVVSQAVGAVAEVNRAAKGFANAVLRNYLRGPEEALARACERDEALWNHPSWWIGRLQQEQPEWWEAILRGGNGSGPLTLRVNRRRTTAEAVNAALAAKKIDAELLSDSMIVLRRPRPVERLPGFRAGDFSVQDAGAQLAAPLLGAKQGMRVLDACAAPGGKTGHLLECEPSLDLTALDRDAGRLEQVRDNLRRLGLTARLVAGDACRPADWWDGVPYDRILVDAPCSATGVIRRHPDIKLLRRESDIAALAQQQEAILAGLWPLLRPGGRLLYATCSVLRQENDQVITAFLASHPDASERPILADWGRAVARGRQILPGETGMDGFYYAGLSKPAAISGA